MQIICAWAASVAGVGVLLVLAFLAPKVLVWYHRNHDDYLRQGLDLGRPGKDAEALKAIDEKPLEEAARTSDTVPLVEFWLKLRAAVEQRANWYYVGLFAGLAALMTGFEKLREAGATGFVLVLAVGVAGIVGGFGVGTAHLYDIARINRIGSVLEQIPDSDRLGLRHGEYLMSAGVAEGVVMAGTVYLFLMLRLACQLIVPTSLLCI
jgi:hypothetical protein